LAMVFVCVIVCVLFFVYLTSLPNVLVEIWNCTNSKQFLNC
jgi:hypothetical protein